MVKINNKNNNNNKKTENAKGNGSNSSDSSDYQQKEQRQRQQQQIGDAGLFTIGLLEAFVSLIESLIIINFITYFTRIFTTTLFDFNSAITNKFPHICIFFDILKLVIPFVSTFLWLKHRYGYAFDHLSFSPFESFSISRVSVVLISFHVLEFFVLLLYQHLRGEWVFSLENYKNKEGCGGLEFSVFTGLYLTVLGPLEEELFYRLLIFFVILYRTSNNAKKNSESKAIQNSVLATSFLFGLSHIYNFIPIAGNQNISHLYILIQVVLGVLVGSVYQLVFLKSRSIWEVIILHIINNILSSFFPITLSLPFYHPMILLPLFAPLFVYTPILNTSWKHISNTKLNLYKTKFK